MGVLQSAPVKRLRRSTLYVLTACLLAGAAPASANLLTERVAKAAQEAVDKGVYKTLVFGVVDGDQSEVVAFGKLDDGKTPDGDTVYEIGSITKTFTATLLADAVLSGRVTLDTPVADLLPGFKIPERNGLKITLGEIATQHSGLPRLPTNFVPKDPDNPYVDYDATRLKAFLADYQLPRDPGAAFEYSNLGFGLLGYALSQSAHTTYGGLVKTKIFEPLHMTMSGTEFSDAMRAHLALGHDEGGKPVKNWDLDALAGAGAIRSTANDMLHYLKANMGREAGPLAAAMKFAHEPRAGLNATARIGLAWITSDKGVVWHNGGTGGYRSYLGFTVDGKRGVVVLSNSAIGVDDLAIAELVFDAPLPPIQASVSLPSGTLDDYTGTYKLGETFLLTITRDGDRLYAQATGQEPFGIFPSSKDEFFARVAGITISFTRDAKGRVNALVLHQGGDRTAPKLPGTPESR